MITVYRKKLESTHGGNCTVRECRVVIAWSGLGEVVDTASMTEGGGVLMGDNSDEEKGVRATG